MSLTRNLHLWEHGPVGMSLPNSGKFFLGTVPACVLFLSVPCLPLQGASFGTFAHPAYLHPDWLPWAENLLATPRETILNRHFQCIVLLKAGTGHVIWVVQGNSYIPGCYLKTCLLNWYPSGLFGLIPALEVGLCLCIRVVMKAAPPGFWLDSCRIAGIFLSFLLYWQQVWITLPCFL